MQWKDIKPGAVVFHTIFTHWGRGVVVHVRGVDVLENLFERGRWRAVVEFEGLDKRAALRASELRKTPNKKKMRAMIAFYQARGVNARISDSGERLLIPKKTKER